jgi:hypothetical protein
MRRRAVPGQGGNRTDLGRRRAAAQGIGWQNDHFRVWPWPEINVIARMAVITGI